MHVPWFERRNLARRWVDATVLLVLDRDGVAGDVGDLTVVGGEQHVAGVARGARLDAGADVGRGRPQQRHGLALHVGAHERAVGVVVLEERDQRGRDRHELLRRHVHVLDLAGRHVVDLAPAGTNEHPRLEEVALLVDAGVGLRDDVLVLVVGGEVRDLVADAALLDLAVRRLDEPEAVDAPEAREVADEPDVRDPPASRSGTCARSGSGARLGPRSPRAHATDRPARAPRGGACA